MTIKHLLDNLGGSTTPIVVLGVLGFAFGEVFDGGVALHVEPVCQALVGCGVEGGDLDVTEAIEERNLANKPIRRNTNIMLYSSGRNVSPAICHSGARLLQ